MHASLLDAVRLMVDSYPGGRPALAVRVGKADDTLRKELSGQEPYKLGAQTACQISAMCIQAKSPHCYAYINVVVAEAGGHFMPLPSIDHLSGDANGRFSRVLREFSDVAEKVAQLGEGGGAARLGPTPAQVKRVGKEWLELVSAGNSFVSWLNGRVAAVKKQHDRAARD